ncbi:MAG: spermidine/putrescine ABC transporter ATP-binding protein [Rhodothermaceae bacterium]|nr:MAG: spermidine/putrescine ABC transporter ATP-binding protein [Rhodothermaceae bacterium]
MIRRSDALQTRDRLTRTDASPGVRLDGVTKRFGDVVAVDDVSLEVRPGEFFSLLGPSGCGKSTLLRLVGGFEQPDAGRILIGGEEMAGVPPQRRPTAMVFQNYALFPTMTVGENVAYGLRVRRLPAAERRRRVQEVLERVDLAHLVDRPVTQLSGGQQQRVAVARALAVRPGVLLFDEPLSNLDVALREQTRRELKLLQRRLGTTSLYVTHDQQEALALSDRIAVMRAGRIQQVGPPEQLYREPETAFVAQFLGGSNLIDDARLAAVLTRGEPPPPGRVLAVRPEHLRLVDEGGIPGRLRARQFLGTFAEWWIETEGTTLRAWMAPEVVPTETFRLEATHYRWVLAADR